MQRVGVVISLAILALGPSDRASAQHSYSWNVDSGTWDTSTANWTGYGTKWANPSGTPDTANFSGTGSAITVGSTAINVGTINFTTTGYTITGGTLTFGGTSPTIGVGSGVTAGIGSQISNNASGLTVSGGGTLTITGTTSNLSNWGTTTVSGSGTTLALGGTVNGVASNDTFLSNLSGAIAVGSGATLRFNQSDTFTLHTGTTGPTSIAATGGTITNAGNAFNTLQNVTLTSGTLTNTGGLGIAGSVVYGAWSIHGTLSSSGTSIVSTTGTNGALNLSYSGTTTFDVGSGTLTISTAVSDDGNSGNNGVIAGTFSKTGSGTAILSGSNNYSGGSTVGAGTLQFAKIASMPASGTVAVSSGAILAVNAGGTGEFTNGTSGNGTIGGLLIGLGGQSGGTVSFASGSALGIDTANAGGGSLSYAGNITNTGLGLVKLGTGSLVLTGANTYTGGTAINAGTLMANSSSGSSATGSGAVAVNSGGTLAGTGYAGAASTGTVTVNSGGTISPGNGTTGNLYLNGNLTYSGGTLQTTLYSTSSNSLLTVAGSTTISSGSITINFGGVTESQLEAAGSHQFTVLSGTISSGSFSGTVTSSSPGFNAGEWSVSADSGHVYLNFAPVPEPGTVILAGLLSLGSIGYGIRRRYRIGREAPAI